VRRLLLSGADSNELPADLDHRRIVDARIAGELGLNLCSAHGRRGQKHTREADQSRYGPSPSNAGHSPPEVQNRRVQRPNRAK
jgi:hypothetical protein